MTTRPVGKVFSISVRLGLCVSRSDLLGLEYNYLSVCSRLSLSMISEVRLYVPGGCEDSVDDSGGDGVNDVY